MADLILSLGSNIGERGKNLKKALLLLQQVYGGPLYLSSLYETAPWGYENQRFFYNQIVVFQTNSDPDDILISIQKTEQKMGRIRNINQYSARIIDIDILFYGSTSMNTSSLTIPHPRITQRKFILIPLCEILPELIHPTVGKTVSSLLHDCEDTLSVRKINLP
ncbi:MAG: 2-amino-4-hydroxy-6-hydroxymethyldihydropteridine diphosphokinase [Bacteroidales bacterium]|nr:2-amino-4-hydroxy-6-hydroxymethyldihydropteridine diphosphokinase [Bacteroidales bacterium]